MDERLVGGTADWLEGQIDEWIDSWMDGWIDG